MEVQLALVKTFLWQTTQANHCMLLKSYNRSYKEPKEGKVMVAWEDIADVTDEDAIAKQRQTQWLRPQGFVTYGVES